MNKSQVKQLYLLLVIILGIITLSIYSTYSIFTLETESSDVVSIHTPSDLSVSSSFYEYKQVTIPKNSYINTDIDIYNSLESELCYSIWYKIVDDSIDKSKIKIYQNSASGVLTSSTIAAVTSRRINIIITNDNNTDVKVNVGLAYTENEGTCELNLSSDKTSINIAIDNPRILADNLIKEVNVKNNQAGYLTYHNLLDEIKFTNDSIIYVSSEFSYKDELFTLNNPQEITSDKLNEYLNYYTCLDKNSCRFLNHITEVTEDETANDIKYYKITKYDTLVGYFAGEIGLRKVANNNINNFYYYGDNPDNFIYYNCQNEADTKTCELWRIIGFFYDKEENKYLTKIIRNDYLTTHEYDDDTNRWDESTIANYLSQYKLNNANTLKEITLKEENVITLDSSLSNIQLLAKENKTKISIINLSDYLYTSSCQKDKIDEYDEYCLNNNWLNKNIANEWTMTTKEKEPYLDEETDEIITPLNNTLYSVGSNIVESEYNEKLNVRPVIYLKHRALLVSGDGTFDNPYVIR